MAISHFTFYKVFIRSIFLTSVKNYSQWTALFDVLTILPLLFYGAVKRKLRFFFRSLRTAPSSSKTDSLSSEELSSCSESWSASIKQLKL